MTTRRKSNVRKKRRERERHQGDSNKVAERHYIEQQLVTRRIEKVYRSGTQTTVK